MLRLVRSSRAFSTSLVRAGTQANINPVVGKKANEVDVKIEPIPRHGEETETKRARLLYQSRKRGILETDLLLSRYAKLYLKDMTREELEEYDALLDEPDWDIFYWATRNENIKPCPERWVKSPVMEKLRELAENKNREVLRMPELN